MGSSISVLADDGSIHQFPDNTDTNVINNVLAQYHAQSQSSQQAQSSAPISVINATGTPWPMKLGPTATTGAGSELAPSGPPATFASNANRQPGIPPVGLPRLPIPQPKSVPQWRIAERIIKFREYCRSTAK